MMAVTTARDVVAAQIVLADLLGDVQERRKWASNPKAYASSRLGGSDEIAAIAALDPHDLDAAALHFDIRRATTNVQVREDADFIRQSNHANDRKPYQALQSNPGPAAPLVGLGYWPELFDGLGHESELVGVWEHRIDDYIYDEISTERLINFADKFPILLHSVELSLGSPQATRDNVRLDRMRKILDATRVRELSDHLCFTRAGNRSLGHFVPLWRIEESVELVAQNINRIQDLLGIRLAIENIALLFDPGGDMTVAQFLNGLVERTGCGILLDITNLTIDENNGFCSADKELALINADAVVGMHLAGAEQVDGLFYDAHAFPLSERDLQLFGSILPRFPNCATVIIERDSRRDAIDEIRCDLRRLREVTYAIR